MAKIVINKDAKGDTLMNKDAKNANTTLIKECWAFSARNRHRYNYAKVVERKAYYVSSFC